MDDDSQISSTQMALAAYGGVMALMKACVRHGLPLGVLLDEIRQAAVVLESDQASPAAEVLRQLAESLESEHNDAPSRE